LLTAAKARSDAQQKNLLPEALQWYNSLLQPQPYNLQQKGHTLFLLERYEESIAVLEPLVERFANPWNRYWLSKCFLATGDPARALRLVEEALGDSRSARFRSAMLEHRFDVRAALGDADAVSDLQEACNLCDNPKYKTALTKRLQGLK